MMPVNYSRRVRPSTLASGVASLILITAGCAHHSACDDADVVSHFTPGSVPWVIGHRGSTNIAAPENTFPAFRAAADVRAGIETDVRTTTDEGHVLIHDAMAARTTGTAAVVAQSTVADLTALDASYAFHPEVFHGAANVPEFGAFLDAFGPTSPLLVHMNSGDVRAVVKAISERGIRGSVVLQSWSWIDLAQAKRADACLRTQIITADHDAISNPDLRGVWGVAMRVDTITPETVRLLRDAGKWVMAWTVNGVWQAENLVAMGISGIITDDPAYMRRLLLSVSPAGTAIQIPASFLGSGWRLYATVPAQPTIAGAFATFTATSSTTPPTYLIYPGVRTPEGSYTLTTTLKLVRAYPDSTTPIGLRFGWNADSDVSSLGRPEPGAQDGFNFQYRANGVVELVCVTGNVPQRARRCRSASP